MTTGLENIDLERIINTIQSNRSISKIILFGSRANGHFSLGSDIDLAVSGKSLETKDIINILIDLDELELPYKFDIVILEKVKDEKVIEHINRAGIVLFERNQF